MRLIDALNRAERTRPKTTTTEEKIGWITELDGRIWEEIIKTHAPDKSDPLTYPPLGYRKENGRLIPDDNAGLASEIFSTFLSCRSVRQTTRQINEEHGKYFSPEVIGGILKNEIYTGRRNGRDGFCAPLVSQETFRAAADIFDEARLYRGTAPDFEPYTEEDKECQLLVPPPYDGLYLSWLEAQIDYENGEIDRYNNSLAMFTQKYEDFSRYWTRTHTPNRTRITYW